MKPETLGWVAAGFRVGDDDVVGVLTGLGFGLGFGFAVLVAMTGAALAGDLEVVGGAGRGLGPCAVLGLTAA